MTLQTPFEDFESTAKRFFIGDIYLEVCADYCVVSGYNVDQRILVVSKATHTEEELKTTLTKSGFKLFHGAWSEEPLPVTPIHKEYFVAAVAYNSGESCPGLWVDGYLEEPNHVQVLENVYREFRHTGELAEVTIEEFIRGTNPTVVIVSKSQIDGFIKSKAEEPSNPR